MYTDDIEENSIGLNMFVELLMLNNIVSNK